MLIVEPPIINHRELFLLGEKAQGSVKSIYLHWTAGHYHQTYDDYHLNIDGDGRLLQTCTQLTDLKAHTYGRNRQSVGITLCCGFNAACLTGGRIDFGAEPPTPVQIDKIAMTVAVLCSALDLEICFANVKTHAEAAFMDGYGPGSNDPETRWDLWMLPDLPLTDRLRPGGEIIRKKALWYRKLFETRRAAGTERS